MWVVILLIPREFPRPFTPLLKNKSQQKKQKHIIALELSSSVFYSIIEMPSIVTVHIFTHGNTESLRYKDFF